MSTLQISQTIPLITEPLVRAGLYPTSEQALKQIVLDFVDRRIAWAQAKVRRLEKKHGRSFGDYTQSLSGKATITDEDEWMEWESLLDMLESWRQVKTEIQHFHDAKERLTSSSLTGYPATDLATVLLEIESYLRFLNQ